MCNTQDTKTQERKLEFPITKNYSPVVPIEIIGASAKSVNQIAVVDTGFTGFLQIPLAVGIGCNLALWSISSSRLADGRTVNNLQCFGQVKFCGQLIWGVITLSEGGADCLLGMQFLELLGGEFCVSMKDQKAIFILHVVSDVTSSPVAA